MGRERRERSQARPRHPRARHGHVVSLVAVSLPPGKIPRSTKSKRLRPRQDQGQRVRAVTAAQTFIVLPSSRPLRTTAPLGNGKSSGNAPGRSEALAEGAQSGRVVTAGPAAVFSPPPPHPARPRVDETRATTTACPRKAGIVSRTNAGAAGAEPARRGRRTGPSRTGATGSSSGRRRRSSTARLRRCRSDPSRRCGSPRGARLP